MAYKFNSDISFPSILALSTSIGVLHFIATLLSYSTPNPEKSNMDMLIQPLLFILVPVTFLLGSGLLILRFVTPSNALHREIYDVRINRLTKMSVFMSLTTLLVGLGIGVYLMLPPGGSVNGSDVTLIELI